MNAKTIILQQLRLEEDIVKELLLEPPKPDLNDAMEVVESLRTITDKHIKLIRVLFHAALVSDPYYLKPGRQNLVSLYSEFDSVIIARGQTVDLYQLDMTDKFFWQLRGRIRNKTSNEPSETANRFEVQAFRAEIIRLLTGVRAKPIVNRWHKK